MATHKYFAKSVVQGSEETFDKCCLPCTEAGKTKEAKNFCVECESSFCEDCLLHHNKFQALRSHQILDRSGKEKGDQRKAGVALPTERCAIHHGKLIDMFCGDHDEVCCAACIAIKHRACVNVDYLPDIAQGIRDSTEMKDTERSLNEALSMMKQQRHTRMGNFVSLDQERDRWINEVEKYESELHQRIKELAKFSKQEICSKHEEYMKTIQSDVVTLDTVISTASTCVQKFSCEREAQLFVNVKTGKKTMKDYETLLRNFSSDKTKKELKFTLNFELKDQLTTLGSVSTSNEDIKEYKASLFGKFKVSPNHCEITGACAMADGTYLVANHSTNQLTRLNENFIVTEEITVDECPYSLQRVRPDEAVVFYSSGKAQLISIRDSMKLTTIFKADETLAGGPFDARNNEIFFIKNEQLCIYRKSGETGILRTYKNKDISLNKEPKQTAVSDDENTIYFANYAKGLLALTRDGKTRWTLTYPELNGAWGVCVLPGDITLVSGFGSNNVLQVSKNGRYIGMLLGRSESLNKPLALAFDRHTSRLVVGCSSNEIRVYSLTKIT